MDCFQGKKASVVDRPPPQLALKMLILWAFALARLFVVANTLTKSLEAKIPFFILYQHYLNLDLASIKTQIFLLFARKKLPKSF